MNTHTPTNPTTAPATPANLSTEPAPAAATDPVKRKETGWFRRVLLGDDGMSTIEYALGSVVAAAIAGVLYLVVNAGGVEEAFESIITDALNNRPG